MNIFQGLLVLCLCVAAASAWQMDQKIYITGTFLNTKETMIIKAVDPDTIDCEHELPGTFFTTRKTIASSGNSLGRGQTKRYPPTFESWVYRSGRTTEDLENMFEYGVAVCDGSSAVPQIHGDKRVEKYVLSSATLDIPPIRTTDAISVTEFERLSTRDERMRAKANSVCKNEFGPDYRVGTNYELLAFASSTGPVEDWSLPIVGRRPGVTALTAENSVTFQTSPLRLISSPSERFVKNFAAVVNANQANTEYRLGGTFNLPSGAELSFDVDTCLDDSIFYVRVGGTTVQGQINTVPSTDQGSGDCTAFSACCDNSLGPLNYFDSVNVVGRATFDLSSFSGLQPIYIVLQTVIVGQCSRLMVDNIRLTGYPDVEDFQIGRFNSWNSGVQPAIYSGLNSYPFVWAPLITSCTGGAPYEVSSWRVEQTNEEFDFDEYNSECDYVPMDDGNWLQSAQAETPYVHINHLESIAMDLSDGIGFSNAYSCNTEFCTLRVAPTLAYPLNGNHDRYYDFYVPGFAQENNPSQSRTVIYPNRAPVFCVHSRAPVQSVKFSSNEDLNVTEYRSAADQDCGMQGIGLVNSMYPHNVDSVSLGGANAPLTSGFGWVTMRAEMKKNYFRQYSDNGSYEQQSPLNWNYDGGFDSSTFSNECSPNSHVGWNNVIDYDDEHFQFDYQQCSTATSADVNDLNIPF